MFKKHAEAYTPGQLKVTNPAFRLASGILAKELGQPASELASGQQAKHLTINILRAFSL